MAFMDNLTKPLVNARPGSGRCLEGCSEAEIVALMSAQGPQS